MEPSLLSRFFKLCFILLIGIIVFDRLSGGAFLQGIKHGLHRDQGSAHQPVSERYSSHPQRRIVIRWDTASPTQKFLTVTCVFSGFLMAIGYLWLLIDVFRREVGSAILCVIFPPAIAYYGVVDAPPSSFYVLVATVLGFWGSAGSLAALYLL